MFWGKHNTEVPTNITERAQLTKIEPAHSDKILKIGQFHLPDTSGNFLTWDHVRDAVIDEITVRGRANPPVVVTNLIRSFLQRLPLPRLLHFVDLVLPQMVPVCSPSQSSGVTFPDSQLIRDLWIARDQGRFEQEPEIKIMRLFKSHAGIEHFQVNWNGQPCYLQTWSLRTLPMYGSTSMPKPSPPCGKMSLRA